MFKWLRSLFRKPVTDVSPRATDSPTVVDFPTVQDSSAVVNPSPATDSCEVVDSPAAADIVETQSVAVAVDVPPEHEEPEHDEPKIVQRLLGELTVRSRTLVLADPQYAPDVMLSKLPRETVSISATIREYPSGRMRLVALAIRTGKCPLRGLRRKVGEITIDSGKLIIADRTDYETYWTDLTQEGHGILSESPDHPAALAQTPWAFLPVANDSAPHIFACRITENGRFKVFVEFDEDRPEGIWIGFEV